MTNAVQDSMRRVLDHAITDSAFPGAWAIAGSHDRVYAALGVGHLDWKQPSPAPDEGTIWDLASLTKIVGMTTAMMQLWAQHRIDLDAPVQRYLPSWTGPGKERVTVRHLLTHSSGLPAWRPLYKESTTAAEALALVYATPLDTVPGARMVYSDLGAILLGQIVERLTGQGLDSYLAEHVFRPLEMASTMYRPGASLQTRIAPTEFDPWRQRQLHGEVHDENAFALGGISAHAGLFSSGRDMARYARMILNGGTLDGVRILTPEAIAAFTRVQDSALSNRALGWEAPNGQNSAGHRLSPHAFGHTGFTGTSLWIDPDHDLFLVLLSNRVNPTRENRRIGGVRIALADAVAGALEASRPARLPSPSPTGVRP
ncbi:MAG: beta-lactamase family protein [Gemmatimonadota bacterium]|nr:beta-lactamase family protein [Gemmatimonadota bacterium]